MPEQIELIEIETSADCFDFLRVPWDRPQTRIVWFIGIGRIQLVVLIELYSVER
jgi:hypothetical protein